MPRRATSHEYTEGKMARTIRILAQPTPPSKGLDILVCVYVCACVRVDVAPLHLTRLVVTCMEKTLGFFKEGINSGRQLESS